MRLAQINGIAPIGTPGSLPTNSVVGFYVSRFLIFATAGAGFIFFVQLVSAGFAYMTAAGDPGKIQAATKTLTHALIGLVIVVSAFFLIQIIQTILGLQIT